MLTSAGVPAHKHVLCTDAWLRAPCPNQMFCTDASCTFSESVGARDNCPAGHQHAKRDTV